MQPTIHIVGYRISRTTALVLGAHPVNTQLDQQALVQALRRQLGLNRQALQFRRSARNFVSFARDEVLGRRHRSDGGDASSVKEAAQLIHLPVTTTITSWIVIARVVIIKRKGSIREAVVIQAILTLRIPPLTNALAVEDGARSRTHVVVVFVVNNNVKPW